jgi:hypothetical protein
MAQPWEPTLLLALVALVLADRALDLVAAWLVAVLVVVAGAITTWSSFDLSWQIVWLWLAAAAAAGDQVARLGHRQPGHVPFGLLARTRSWPAFAITSVTVAVVWAAGLVLAGRLLGQLTHLWFLALVAVLVCVVPRGTSGSHRTPVVTRKR